jgi:hypothetical protein
VPDTSTSLSPNEVLTFATSPDYKRLQRTRVIGCPVFVLDPTLLQDAKNFPNGKRDLGKESSLDFFLNIMPTLLMSSTLKQAALLPSTMSYLMKSSPQLLLQIYRLVPSPFHRLSPCRLCNPGDKFNRGRSFMLGIIINHKSWILRLNWQRQRNIRRQSPLEVFIIIIYIRGLNVFMSIMATVKEGLPLSGMFIWMQSRGKRYAPLRVRVRRGTERSNSCDCEGNVWTQILWDSMESTFCRIVAIVGFRLADPDVGMRESGFLMNALLRLNQPPSNRPSLQ